MIHKLTRTLALAAATGAIAAPAASAMLPAPDPVTRSTAGFAPQPLTVNSVKSDGFDYGDAAIGAGAAIAVLLAAGGGTFAVQRIRRPQMSPTARA
jgi:hypothetical protein